MSYQEPPVYLLHIRECCERILEYAAFAGPGSPPATMSLDAICRNLEIIGEASRKVDPAFREAHPEIPWRQMGDLRNVLIHAYEGVAPEIVWGVVSRDIPPLLAAVRKVLGEDPG